MTTEDLLKLLELKVKGNDAGEDLTIRQYLRELLAELWKEDESFTGYRPFGNSGWQGDIYIPLVLAGALKGYIDEDGWLSDFDEDDGKELVLKLISAAMAK
jgi:hypothetical protein